MTRRDRLTDVTREWMFGSIMPRKFLDHLAEHVGESWPDEQDELMAEVRDRIPGIIEANEDVFADEAGRDLLGLCATLLAAYRVLEPKLGDEKRTLGLLTHIGTAFGRRSTKLGTRLMMAGRGNKLDTVQGFFEKTAPVLGESWTVTYERDDDRSFEMRFTSCGFNDFFRHNGVPALTTVLCAWDRTWMDELSPERDGIRASRPTTLGAGGPACPFRFEVSS